MKKIVLIVLTLLLLTSALMASDTENAKSNAFTSNPIGLAYGIFNGTFHIGISRLTTITLTGGYAEDGDASGFFAGTGLRFYMSGRVNYGFYLEPSLSYGYASNKTSYAKAFSCGFGVGFMINLGDTIVLDLGLGVMEIFEEDDDSTNDSTALYLNTSIGFKF